MNEVQFSETTTWTASKVREIGHETMDSPPQTSVLRWHVIMPQGKYSDESVLGVAVDATIVRALVVPATMRLMGDLNWWTPKWLGGEEVSQTNMEVLPLPTTEPE